MNLKSIFGLSKVNFTSKYIWGKIPGAKFYFLNNLTEPCGERLRCLEKSVSLRSPPASLATIFMRSFWIWIALNGIYNSRILMNQQYFAVTVLNECYSFWPVVIVVNISHFKTDHLLIILLSQPNSTSTRVGASGQLRKLIFGMQPYFDPTRKTTSKKKWKTTSKKIKWKTT